MILPISPTRKEDCRVLKDLFILIKFIEVYCHDSSGLRAKVAGAAASIVLPYLAVLLVEGEHLARACNCQQVFTDFNIQSWFSKR